MEASTSGSRDAELFRKAFAARFASLDSLVSSSSLGADGDSLGDDGGFFHARGGAGGGSLPARAICRTCDDLSAFDTSFLAKRGFSCWKALKLTAGVLAALGLAVLLWLFFWKRCTVRPLGRDTKSYVDVPQPVANDQHTLATLSHPNEISAVGPKGKLGLVLVHAEWCGHCKQMMPHFDMLAHRWKERPVNFGKIESTALKKGGEGALDIGDLNVTGYPTTLAVSNGKVVGKLVGAKNSEDLETFVLKHLPA